MSDTPITDSQEHFIDCDRGIVDSGISRQLERELNAANERIKRLEEFIADVSKQWECDCWYNTGPECKCCRAEGLLNEAKP